MVIELPKIEIEGKTYYIDRRLRELRNVENPYDRREIPFELKDFDIVAITRVRK